MEKDKVFQEIAEKSNAIVRVGKDHYKIVASQIIINKVRITEPSEVHFCDDFMTIGNVFIDLEDIEYIYIGSDMEWDDNGPISSRK